MLVEVVRSKCTLVPTMMALKQGCLETRMPGHAILAESNTDSEGTCLPCMKHCQEHVAADCQSGAGGTAGVKGCWNNSNSDKLCHLRRQIHGQETTYIRGMFSLVLLKQKTEPSIKRTHT